MYKWILKSNKGSSLVLVMLALAVLSLLGVALLSLTLVNYKVQMADEKINTSFYLSESGLDQAYQKICLEVKAAIDDAQQKINAINMDAYIANERAKEVGDEENGIFPVDSPLIKNFINGSINPNGEIDQDELYNLLNGWFKGYYFAYMTKLDSGELALVKKLDNGAFPITAVYQSLYAGVSSIPKVSVINKTVNTSDIEVTLLSEFIHEGITKQTRVTYKIDTPNYLQKYELKSEVKYDMAKNALYAKALVAEKDIKINGRNVEINGDIYARGNPASLVSNAGIIIGDNVTLSIKGKVLTNAFFKADGNGAVVSISGDVYCNTIFTDEDTDNNTITVGTSAANNKYNVSTVEDLRMDGLRSNISIYGNYYGFSRGETADLNRSSIIVNSDDFGMGSSLKITGESPANNKFSDGITNKPSGSVIAGSSFIKLEDSVLGMPVLYQTGESLSIKGNYAAYTIGLDNADISNPADKNKFDQAHIYFESLTPLYIATGFDLNSDGVIDDENSYFGAEPVHNYDINGITHRVYKGLDDKIKYFMYSYNKDNSLIRFGTSSALDIKNVVYSTGVYIDRLDGSNPQEKRRDTTILATMLPKLQNEYNYFIRTMGDPQITNYLDDAQFNDNPSDGTPDTEVRVSDRFNFSEDYKSFSADKKELLYANINPNKGIVIKGPADVSPVYTPVGDLDVYSLNDTGSVDGIIVTRGDVYLTGKVNFRGAIITTGNIYIMDDNKKVITNDYNEKSFTDANNYVVKQIHAHKKEAGTQLGDLFNSPGTQKIFIVESKVTVPQDNDYINFEEIIFTQSWKKVK